MAALVLDLNNNGINCWPRGLLHVRRPERRRLEGKDGLGKPDDGVLAYDADNDGLIDVLDEVSFVKYKTGAYPQTSRKRQVWTPPAMGDLQRG